MAIQRLICIGNQCPPLAPEAFKLAINLLKKTLDVTTYREAVKGLANVAPNDANAVLDEEWIEQTSKTVRLKTEKLEAELKSYKNNMIKESIRVCIGFLPICYSHLYLMDWIHRQDMRTSDITTMKRVIYHPRLRRTVG